MPGDVQNRGRREPAQIQRALLALREVRRRGVTSRKTLRTELAIPRTTFNNAIKDLVDGGVLANASAGLSLEPDLGLLVGVDITHSKAQIAVSNLGYELLTDPESDDIGIGNPQATIQKIASMIADALEAVGEPEGTRLVGIGLALPGPIVRAANPDVTANDEQAKEAGKLWDRRVQAGLILPSWDNIAVAEELAVRLKRRHGVRPLRHEERRIVWMENDASAGALGVHTLAKLRLGDAAPEDLVYVRITRGIGGGIVNKGHLVNGARGFAGELGHMVVNPAGPLCTSCGGRGCLDTLASNRALVEQLAGLLGIHPSEAHGFTGAEIDTHIRTLLSSKHPAVDRALWDAGWHIGTVLANVACLLNPEWIVLDGDTPAHRYENPAGGDAEGPLIGAVEHAIKRTAMPQVRDQAAKVLLWRDGLGSNGGSTGHHDIEQTLSPELLGALALAVDHLGDGYLLAPVKRWLDAKPGVPFDPAVEYS